MGRATWGFLVVVNREPNCGSSSSQMCPEPWVGETSFGGKALAGVRSKCFMAGHVSSSIELGLLGESTSLLLPFTSLGEIRGREGT